MNLGGLWKNAASYLMSKNNPIRPLNKQGNRALLKLPPDGFLNPSAHFSEYGATGVNGSKTLASRPLGTSPNGSQAFCGVQSWLCDYLPSPLCNASGLN
jgi:hypothetical protein